MRGAASKDRLRTIGVMVLLGLAAVACGGGTKSPDTAIDEGEGRTNIIEDDSDPIPGGSLVYALEAETDGFHPGLSRWAPSGLEVARSIYDMLTVYDDEGGWAPWLAETLVPNDDYTEWTLTLREGVTFSDGTPLDAEAVLANFRYHMDSPLTHVPFTPLDEDELEVVDARTLRIPLEEPWVNMPMAFTTQIGAIAQPELMQSVQEFTRNPIGSGPFVMEEWVTDDHLTVSANRDWWYDGYPLLDSVIFRPIPDGQTRVSALKTGDVDVAMISDAEVLSLRDDLVERDGLQWFEDEGGETNESVVMLNTAVPPFDDVRARRALALATDRQTLVDSLFQSIFTVANGPFAPDSPFYSETEFPQYDAAAAKALIEELGGLDFEILGVADPTALQTLQYLVDQWGDVGMDVSIRTIEQSTFITQVLTGSYQATVWRQFDSPHPLGDTIWWLCDSASPMPEFALNFARNCDEEGIDAEADAARKETDPVVEREHYQAIMRALAVDIPYVWLYHLRIAFAARQNVRDLVQWETPEGVTGLPVHGGSHPLHQVWLAGR